MGNKKKDSTNILNMELHNSVYIDNECLKEFNSDEYKMTFYMNPYYVTIVSKDTNATVTIPVSDLFAYTCGDETYTKEIKDDS